MDASREGEKPLPKNTNKRPILLKWIISKITFSVFEKITDPPL